MSTSASDLDLAQAIAQALADLRVSVITHVPGYGGTETFAEVQRLAPGGHPGSYHEEAAYTVAHGAALVGARAACLIKTHGLAKATNSVLSSLSVGTLGGLVVFAFDDPEGAHSDNIFDAAGFIQGSEIPWQDLGLEAVADGIQAAFERSEACQLPVLLRIDTRQVRQPARTRRIPSDWQPHAFQSRPAWQTACPPLAPFQRRIFEARRAGDPSWRAATPPAFDFPAALPEPLRSAALAYVPVFDAFVAAVRRPGGPVVAGDAGTSGLFGLTAHRAIDVVTCMGGSTALAVGATLGSGRPAWAVSGDFSFLAAGHLGLVEATLRRQPFKLLLLHNGEAAATGGQPVDPALLRRILRPWEDALRILPADAPAAALRAAFTEADQASAPRILVVCTGPLL